MSIVVRQINCWYFLRPKKGKAKYKQKKRFSKLSEINQSCQQQDEYKYGFKSQEFQLNWVYLIEWNGGVTFKLK